VPSLASNHRPNFPVEERLQYFPSDSPSVPCEPA